jgi:hypothetical protein
MTNFSELRNLLGNTKDETIALTCEYAQINNYKVNEMYNLADTANMVLMSEIHNNGKRGDYDTAIKYAIIRETLETWV